jgi:lipopolysaccharide/colanic/teichoic acid biosynthesis glycosyltransferase
MMAIVTEEIRVNTTEQTLRERTVFVRNDKCYLLFKRLMDIVFAAVFGIALLIPMLIIGCIIKMDSEGPAIFSQERLGLNGKPFVMYKFRSMVLNAEVNGPCWAEKDDDRCTRVGRILRKTRLDELPQLYNILIGDMSFVGPRPERDCFYDEFESYIPHFRKRLLVQPGLTGFAQVNGGYDLKPEEKIEYDLVYMQKRSLWMDLLCIFKTFLIVFSHDGAR